MSFVFDYLNVLVVDLDTAAKSLLAPNNSTIAHFPEGTHLFILIVIMRLTEHGDLHQRSSNDTSLEHLTKVEHIFVVANSLLHCKVIRYRS